MARVLLYCDGACRGNPGPGGFGAVLERGGRTEELRGFAARTTNNRMELLGAIAGLEAIRDPAEVEVRTDSEYVVKGMTRWLPAWQRRGWRTADRKPVRNRDLWERLARAASVHRVRWSWVPGHAGVEGNERCDRLANEAIDGGLAGELPPVPDGAAPPDEARPAL